jgi:hypothetical protein
MPEEIRFFLRTAVYAGAIAAVYWFVSYEPAGSVMLLAVGISGAALAVVFGRSARAPIRIGPVTLARALATFEEPVEGSAAALALDEDEIPAASLVPLVVVAGAAAIAGGAVFGAWLWLPGAALAAIAGWSWLAEPA